MCVFTELSPRSEVSIIHKFSYGTSWDCQKTPSCSLDSRNYLCSSIFIWFIYYGLFCITKNLKWKGTTTKKKRVSLLMKKLNRYPLISSVLEAQNCLLFTWYFLKPSSTWGRGAKSGEGLTHPRSQNYLSCFESSNAGQLGPLFLEQWGHKVNTSSLF